MMHLVNQLKYDNLDRASKVLGLFLEIKKAFDCVQR